jgi:tetratricopeptide (TPR) repeat protein
MGIKVVDVKGYPRNDARNRMIDMAKTERHFWIEPWEAVMQGHSILQTFNQRAGYVQILTNKIINYDVRLWDGKDKFINPAYERLNVDMAPIVPIVLYSKGRPEDKDIFSVLEQWKADEPLSARPYYYQAYELLSLGKYDEFIKIAEHYMFIDKSTSMSATMIRYYYAMIQLMYKRAFKPALQNINLCLCTKPLMAEFWCLMGDVYYHLLNRFNQAKEFYENAIILGSRRLKNDTWPMDIRKYNAYPKKMIESCNKIMHTTSFYVKQSTTQQLKTAGLVIPNFMSGLTDGWHFTPADTEFEDKSNRQQ